MWSPPPSPQRARSNVSAMAWKAKHSHGCCVTLSTAFGFSGCLVGLLFFSLARVRAPLSSATQEPAEAGPPAVLRDQHPVARTGVRGLVEAIIDTLGEAPGSAPRATPEHRLSALQVFNEQHGLQFGGSAVFGHAAAAGRGQGGRAAVRVGSRARRAQEPQDGNGTVAVAASNSTANAEGADVADRGEDAAMQEESPLAGGEEGAEGEEDVVELEHEILEAEDELVEAQELGTEHVNLAIALMLLGAISMVMTMFTMVHTEDEDMRLYVWQVINATVAIFLAVLFFTSVNEMVHASIRTYFTIGDTSDRDILYHAAGDFAQFCTYFLLMQVTVAANSSVFTRSPIDHRKTARVRVNGVWRSVRLSSHDQKLAIETRMRSFAVMLAHTSGFAAINFGGSFQQLSLLSQSPSYSFIVPPAMFIFLITICRWARIVRLYIKHQTFPSDNLHYHAVSLDMRDRHELMTKWDACAFGYENDFTALCVSFLMVQSTRFAISGNLPNTLGVEEDNYVHSSHCSVLLGGTSLFFASLSVVLVILVGGGESAEVGEGNHGRWFVLRFIKVLQDGSAMAFAWCLNVVCRWELARMRKFGSPNDIICRIVIALVVSFVAFFLIMGLDKLADLSFTGESADAAIVSLIHGLSVLVGFAWEQSFEGGVEVIAELTPNPITTEFALALGVSSVVVFPWRRYILRKVVRLESDYAERKSTDLQAIASGGESDDELRKFQLANGVGSPNGTNSGSPAHGPAYPRQAT